MIGKLKNIMMQQIQERMPNLEISETDWELLLYHAEFVLQPHFEIKQIEKKIEDLERQIRVAKRRKETDAVEEMEKEILQQKLDIAKIIEMARDR